MDELVGFEVLAVSTAIDLESEQAVRETLQPQEDHTTFLLWLSPGGEP